MYCQIKTLYNMLSNKEIKKATKLVIPKNYLNNLPSDYRGNSLRTIKVTQINDKKVILKRYSDFVTLQTVILNYFSYGIKATVKVNTNYRRPYQYTMYFDNKGNEIDSNNGTTDRQKWSKLVKKAK